MALLDNTTPGFGLWRRFLAIAGLLFLLSPLAPASAALIEWMGAAENEEEALASGLEEVLVRLAGLHSPEVDALVPDLLEADERPWLRSREQRGEGRFLLVFDRARLRAALQEAEVPVWVGSRPALVVWAVLERGERRLLLGSGMDEDSVLAELREWSARRELPLLIPLGDLEDRRQVHSADVIGGAVEALLEPSRRYDADGLLLVHVFKRGEHQRARVWVIYRNHQLQAEASAATTVMAVREAVTEAMDALGARTARVLAEQESALVGFSGVDDMTDLRSLRARLVAMEAVQGTQLNRLLPGVAVLELRTGLDTAALAEVLAAEGFQAAAAPRDVGMDADLWFLRASR
ncbi:DUF2066 domain-containing protein [Thioalkalivibrio sp.]|uniref:DUF2066 domain-containing protein n=1 Tax=Thioalkalivibrio sp. TaxID=2093813 RepID=UPI0039771085